MDTEQLAYESKIKLEIMSHALKYTGLANAIVLADFIIMRGWHIGTYKDKLDKLVDMLYLKINESVAIRQSWEILYDYASLNKVDEI
ncbi:hypothetical protein ABWK22_02480 [Gottfriedia acidiceleris]|uniref:hypothetical protein n=1 Tax=Gottfriedia acidiceleris TaxID=371036 RepID=UPI003391DED5